MSLRRMGSGGWKHPEKQRLMLKMATVASCALKKGQRLCSDTVWCLRTVASSFFTTPWFKRYRSIEKRMPEFRRNNEETVISVAVLITSINSPATKMEINVHTKTEFLFILLLYILPNTYEV